MSKNVLISYLERNKKFSIPTEKDVTDVEYLRRKFIDAFSFSDRNVNLVITFQAYEPDWDSYVEIEDDADIPNMAKLKAVVMPVLQETCSTPSVSECGSSKKKDDSTFSPISSVHDTDLDFKNNDDVTPSRKRKQGSPSTLFSDDSGVIEQFDSDNVPIKEEVVVSTKKRPKPCEDPLPNPFPLPKNFRPDVELALSSGKMTNETRTAYINQVGSAIFGYKRYPDKEELVHVADAIVKKYPFLESPLPGGSKTGAIKQSLINRLKQLRRSPRDRTSVTQSEKKVVEPKLKKPSANSLFDVPPLPPGEDEVSLRRHVQVLSNEYTKSKRGRGNQQLVNSLMEKTFPVRRADILSESLDLNSILVKYPYLQCSDQLYMDMQRLLIQCGSSMTSISFGDSWMKLWTKRIILQAINERSSNRRLKLIMDTLNISEDSVSPLLSLALVPYLLRDPRCVPDHHRLVYSLPISCDPDSEIKKRSQNQPYLLACGELHDPEQLYLVIDCEMICEVTLKESVFALLSGFYVFNIHYTPGCNMVYTFLEALLNFKGKRTLPPTVTHFMAALSAHCKD